MPLGSFTFEFYAPNTKFTLYAKNERLTADGANHGLGNETLTGVTRRNYNLAVTGDTFLRTVAKNVTTTGNAAIIPPASLLGGDPNNDNICRFY